MARLVLAFGFYGLGIAAILILAAFNIFCLKWN